APERRRGHPYPARRGLRALPAPQRRRDAYPGVARPLLGQAHGRGRVRNPERSHLAWRAFGGRRRRPVEGLRGAVREGRPRI
ncbi:MAG: hypothetical protein AVDCRST_MAG55-2009, partial [uncultured Rubrobacteraceae bacterium]